jgi:hypothetical protein
MESVNEDIFERNLRFVAADLDLISSVKGDEYRYDAMTESLVWRDELPPRHLVAACNGLRPIFRYRASLSLMESDPEWECYWNLGKALFPNWIGFSEIRIHPSGDALDLLRREVQKARERTSRILSRPPRRPRSPRN